MEGIIPCNSGVKIVYYEGVCEVVSLTPQELAKDREYKIRSGLFPNVLLDCYVGEKGAYMGYFYIKDMQDKSPKKFLKTSLRFSKYYNDGYDLVLGPAPIGLKDAIGVYCANYQEIYNREKDDSVKLSLKYPNRSKRKQ